MCLDTNYKLLKKSKHMQVSSNKKKWEKNLLKPLNIYLKLTNIKLELHNFLEIFPLSLIEPSDTCLCVICLHIIDVPTNEQFWNPLIQQITYPSTWTLSANPYYSSEQENFQLSSTILWCTQDKCPYMLTQEKEGYTTQIKDAICDKKLQFSTLQS